MREQITILVPKPISALWPITCKLFEKLGINYDKESRKYRLAKEFNGSSLDFYLGRPEDWNLALTDFCQAAVTSTDLVANGLAEEFYVKRKRLLEKNKMFDQEALESGRTQYIPIYRELFEKTGYSFKDATNLKGLPYTCFKLKMGKGRVILGGNLIGSLWSPLKVACWNEYVALSELWLDENYYGSDNVGYRLYPYKGSAEGVDANCVIEFTENNGRTAKENGKEPVKSILGSQALVLTNDDKKTIIKELFDELI